MIFKRLKDINIIRPVSNLLAFNRLLMHSLPPVLNGSFLAGENCFMEYANKTEPKRKRAVPGKTKIIVLAVIESRDRYPKSHLSLNLKSPEYPMH